MQRQRVTFTIKQEENRKKSNF